MAQWCSVSDIPRYFTRKESDELSFDEKYSILCNGKRYKKDSREWLHKTRQKPCRLGEEQNSIKIGNDSDDGGEMYNCCRNDKYQKNPCTLKDLLGSEIIKTLKTAHGCKSFMNIDETAKSSEMFASYRKRRHVSSEFQKSPSGALSERELNSNTSEKWLLSHRYFLPISENQEERTHPREQFTENAYENAGDSLDVSWTGSLKRSMVDTTCTEDSTSRWRYPKTISSSDSSSVSTPADDILDTSSASRTSSPPKRFKREDCVKTPSMINFNDPEGSLDSTCSGGTRTSCSSPWMPLQSITDSISISEDVNKP